MENRISKRVHINNKFSIILLKRKFNDRCTTYRKSQIKVLNEFFLRSSFRVFLSSDPIRVNGGSYSTQRQIDSIITTVPRRKPSGTSRKIVISSHWPNCKFSNRQLNHQQTNPKMHHKRSSKGWISTRGIRKRVVKRTAPDEVTTASVPGMSCVRDLRDRRIRRTAVETSKSNKRSYIQLMTSWLANRTSFASMVDKDQLATVRSTWIQESQATRACQVPTTIERFKKEEVFALEVFTLSLATNTTQTTLIECSKKAQAPITFPIRVIWCRRYPTHLTWLQATANLHRTQLERHLWRRDFNTRTKLQVDHATVLQSHRNTKASIMGHRKQLASLGREASWHRSAVPLVALRFNSNEKDPSMVMEVTTQCTKSTSSQLRILQFHDEGTQHHRKIDLSQAIQVHNLPSVHRIR